jgi:hypothetical protein
MIEDDSKYETLEKIGMRSSKRNQLLVILMQL